MEIVPATPEEMNPVRDLLREYQRLIGVDLCFQGFEAELAALPGDYAPPSGRLLLAKSGGDLCGCIALRKLSDSSCEMKRLFVRTAFQGKGIGQQLASALIEEARAMGYRKMRLDTLPTMKEATRLYGALGFRPIPPYNANPVEGAAFFEKDL